jgi:transcriptional regulator with XRE-family HTH domain
VQDRANSFGYWLRRRRKALDLTQEALADRVACSVFSIRKLESDERRPSRRLAERLVAALAIPAEEQRAFLDAARQLRAAARMRVDDVPRTPPTRRLRQLPPHPFLLATRRPSSAATANGRCCADCSSGCHGPSDRRS